MEPSVAVRLAELSLACVSREYPNRTGAVLGRDEDLRAPRLVTPAFHGCFDWHSAVHNHWALVRLTRLVPDAPFAARARAVLQRNLTAENIAAEVANMRRPGHEGFERPYGLAWLLQLAAELRGWRDGDATALADALEPLESLARERLCASLPKLAHPIRSGEHSQTAFSLGLFLDWARATGDRQAEMLVCDRARAFFGDDTDGPIRWEPSGHDFLSPCLGEADLMRRVLAAREFEGWLDGFLPSVPLVPVRTPDPSDGRLAHLDGLNLSRAWMLEGIAACLPEAHPRRQTLVDLAASHRVAGLESVTGAYYEGGHWLASFAVYLLTSRGTLHSPDDS